MTTNNDERYDGLTGFQRDLILSTLREGGTPTADNTDRPHGLAVKDDLESRRGIEVHHGRLYPNFDTLVDKGYVVKCELDRRTNGYAVTNEGVDALFDYHDNFYGEALEQIKGVAASDVPVLGSYDFPTPADD